MVTGPVVPAAVAMSRARASAAALFTVPPNPLTTVARACPSSAMNLGTANAARMPRMVITTTSSIRVNPLIFAFILKLSWRIGASIK